MPTIFRRIFGYTPHLDRFPQNVAVRVMIRPSATNPRKSRATPNYPEMGLTKPIISPRPDDLFLYLVRCGMRLSSDTNQWISLCGARARLRSVRTVAPLPCPDRTRD